MKFNSAYIISYRGPMPDELWNKRYAVHVEQVQFFLGLGMDVFVFQQHDEPHIEGVTYFPWDGTRHYIGNARNVLLRHFYKTDDDFAIFLDDDITIYESSEKRYMGDGLEIVNIFRDMDVELLKDVDIFNPVVPEFDHYGKFYRENRSVIEKSLWFERRPHLAGALYFLKNLRKHHGKEYYYREDYFNKDGTTKVGTDAYFSMDLTRNGIKSYKCMNFVMRNRGDAFSTISVEGDDELKLKRMLQAKDDLVQEFNLETSTRKDGKTIVFWDRFAAQYNPHRRLLIPKTGIVDNGILDFAE